MQYVSIAGPLSGSSSLVEVTTFRYRGIFCLRGSDSIGWVTVLIVTSVVECINEAHPFESFVDTFFVVWHVLSLTRSFFDTIFDDTMSDDTEVQFILFYLFCIYRVFNVNSTLNSHNIIVYYQIQSTLSSHLPTTRLAISVSPQNIFVFSTELGIFSGYESKNYVLVLPYWFVSLCANCGIFHY